MIHWRATEARLMDSKLKNCESARVTPLQTHIPRETPGGENNNITRIHIMSANMSSEKD